MAKSVRKEEIKAICAKYKERYENLDTSHVGELLKEQNAIADEIAKEICQLYNKATYGLVAMSFLKDAKKHYFASKPKVVILRFDDMEPVMHIYNSYLDKLFRAYPAPLVLEVMKDEVFSSKIKELGINALALLLGSNTIDTVMKICETMKEEDELL
jgi:hypothetical protein